MTKTEYIEKYGIERYELHKADMKKRQKERYNNDSKFREAHKAKCSIYNSEYYREHYHNNAEYREIIKKREKARCKYRYCKEGEFELIENYELAKADNFKGWVIHHRDEIRTLPSGIVVYRPMQDLIDNGRYYDCPANELIFLTDSDHKKLHIKTYYELMYLYK